MTKRLRADDGVHFTAAGYELIAERIVGLMLAATANARASAERGPPRRCPGSQLTERLVAGNALLNDGFDAVTLAHRCRRGASIPSPVSAVRLGRPERRVCAA